MKHWWMVIKTIGVILGMLLVTLTKVVLGLLAGVFVMIAFLAHFVSGPRL